MPILIADKGHTFPLALLESAAKLNPIQWGVAVFRKNKLETIKETAAMDVKELDGIQKEFKDQNFLLYMTRGAEATSEEEQQPFTLLSMESGEKNPMLVACINGAFPTYKKDTQAATYKNVVDTFLRPKLDRTFEKCDKDMAKLMKALDDDNFRDLMDEACKPNGTIALFASNGECLFYNQNSEAKKMPFGFTTDLLGLKEESFQQTKKSALSSLSDAATEVPKEEPDKVAEPPVEGRPDAEPEKKTIVDANAQLKDTETKFVWIRPKKESGTKAVDNFYYKVCNYLGIKKDTVRMVKEKPAMRVSQEFFAKSMHQAAEVVNPPPKEEQQKFMAFVDPKSSVIAEKLAEAESKVEVVPKASVENLKFMRELKLQTGVSDEVLQGLEKKYPSYFQQGHSWEEVKKWPFANFTSLAEDPLAISLLAWTLTAKLRNIEPRLAASMRDLMELKPESKERLAM